MLRYLSEIIKSEYVMRCAICYHFSILINVKNTHRGVFKWVTMKVKYFRISWKRAFYKQNKACREHQGANSNRFLFLFSCTSSSLWWFFKFLLFQLEFFNFQLLWKYPDSFKWTSLQIFLVDNCAVKPYHCTKNEAFIKDFFIKCVQIRII